MRVRERWRDNIMYYCTYKFFGMNLASFGCALNIFFHPFPIHRSRQAHLNRTQCSHGYFDPTDQSCADGGPSYPCGLPLAHRHWSSHMSSMLLVARHSSSTDARSVRA